MERLIEIKSSRRHETVEKKAVGNILYLAPSYTFQQYLSLWKSLESWRDICEHGWNVDISLQVANGWTLEHPMITDMLPTLYCHRMAKVLNITITQFGDIGFGLNSKHRAIIKERLQQYDYFVFAEEDMLFTIHNLQSYLFGMEQLKHLFAENWKQYTVGFLRFEEKNSSLSRVTWEYFPQHVFTHFLVIVLHSCNILSFKVHVVREKNVDFIVTNNLNQVRLSF